MKKFIFTILALILFTTTPIIKPVVAEDMAVVFVSVLSYGGAYITDVVQFTGMTKAEAAAALGPPTREYGYNDTWLSHDQIYIAYYDVFGVVKTVIILPVTSW